MGHTLVTRFDGESLRFIHSLMDPWAANKIPYGRNCDRVLANEVLDYHATLFHWPKTQDAYYLPRVQKLHSYPCRIAVTGVEMIVAEEGSWLLFFTVKPAPDFLRLVGVVEEQMEQSCVRMWHITLAVSKDPERMQRIRNDLVERICFPVSLQIEGLDLYHIWRPTEFVGSL